MTPPAPAPPPLPTTTSTTTQDDPLGQAIVSEGIDDSSQPLSDTSKPIQYHVPDLDSSTHDADDSANTDTADDIVVFDSTQMDGKPPTRHQANGSIGRASVESVSFGFKDNLLPLSLSRRDDYDYEGDEDDDQTEGSRGGTGNQSRRYGDVEGAIEAGNTGSGGSSSRQSRRRRYKDPERRMNLIDGIALTVGLQIGSGIFSSPGVVTFNTGSIGASLLIWLLSGVLAWTGASSFAELGSAIPQNGGAQAYLNYSLGGLASYLFSWTAIVALKPGSGAIIAIIFGEYLARILYHATGGDANTQDDPHQQGLEGIPQWSVKLIACVIVILVSALNAISARLGTKLQVTTTVLKLGAMIAVPILALIFTLKGHTPEASREAFSSVGALFANSSVSPSAYALALYSGLWAYDGWDQSSYVAGEMKRVSRDLPRVIHISMTLVVTFFLLTVTSYFLVLPASQVKRTNTVALDFGSAIFGSTGGIIFAIVVAFSCFGALNSQIYTSSRLVYAAGKEGYLPTLFGRIHPRTATPVAATVFQGVLVLLFILFGSGFASLVSFYGVCSYTWYFLTVLGLLILRVKEPNLERPYRTFLTTPLLFATTALFLLLMPIASAPLEAGAAFAFMALGLPVYFVTQREGREVLKNSGVGSAVLRICGACGGKKKNSSAQHRQRGGNDDDAASQGGEEEEVEMLARRSSDRDDVQDDEGEDEAHTNGRMKRYSTLEKGKGRAYDDDNGGTNGEGGHGRQDTQR